MIRLETVEDFEKVDKALDNPDSKLNEYCVAEYGYCGFCGLLCVCDNISIPEHYIRCHECGNSFYPDHIGLSYLYHQNRMQVFEFKFGDDLPKHSQSGGMAVTSKELSKEYQRELFNVMLEARITALKKEQRGLAGKVRQLAKLRT